MIQSEDRRWYRWMRQLELCPPLRQCNLLLCIKWWYLVFLVHIIAVGVHKFTPNLHMVSTSIYIIILIRDVMIRIRILLFSAVVFKMQTKKKFYFTFRVSFAYYLLWVHLHQSLKITSY
jgi:hypothetical protein